MKGRGVAGVAAADSGLSGALGVGAQIGGPEGEAQAAAARLAFVDGLGTAAFVGAGFVFAAAIATRLLLPPDSCFHEASTPTPVGRCNTMSDQTTVRHPRSGHE